MLFKREKICYNENMSNYKNRNSEGFVSSLIGERTSAKTAGLTYTVAALVIFGVSFLLLMVMSVAQASGELMLYLNYLAAPIAFLLVGVWYFSYTKTTVKTFIKEQKCPWKYYLIAILLQVGLFGLSEVNGYFLQFLEGFGYTPTEIELPSMEGFGFIGVFLTIAVLPAIMEEFVFRGVFLRETKDFSLLARVLICGGLFALYHQNPAQTIYQFICGMAFALVAIKSGSILPTVLSHFINNGVILILTKFGVESFTATAYVIILITAGLCLVASLVYLLAFDRQKEEKKKGNYGQLFACAGLGIFLLLLSWGATFLTGM